MDTICTNCPMGCQLHIVDSNGIICVTGNTCKRGESYGIREYSHPHRSLTTLVWLKNGEIASCKTSGVIPKEKIFDVLNFISSLVVDDNVEIGDVVCKNVLNLGVDIVITGRR